MFSGTNCFDSSMEDMTASSCHVRAFPGHPRLQPLFKVKTWMAGTSGAKTRFALLPGHNADHFPGSTHNAPAAKLLQACTVPCWKPVMNHCLRCAAEPWVKESGTT